MLKADHGEGCVDNRPMGGNDVEMGPLFRVLESASYKRYKTTSCSLEQRTA